MWSKNPNCRFGWGRIRVIGHLMRLLGTCIDDSVTPKLTIDNLRLVTRPSIRRRLYCMRWSLPGIKNSKYQHSYHRPQKDAEWEQIRAESTSFFCESQSGPNPCCHEVEDAQSSCVEIIIYWANKRKEPPRVVHAWTGSSHLGCISARSNDADQCWVLKQK